jgi:hypothetical protein
VFGYTGRISFLPLDIRLRGFRADRVGAVGWIDLHNSPCARLTAPVFAGLQIVAMATVVPSSAEARYKVAARPENRCWRK